MDAVHYSRMAKESVDCGALRCELSELYELVVEINAPGAAELAPGRIADIKIIYGYR